MKLSIVQSLVDAIGLKRLVSKDFATKYEATLLDIVKDEMVVAQGMGRYYGVLFRYRELGKV